MKIAKPKRSSARLPRMVLSNWRDRVDPAFVAHYSARKENYALVHLKDDRESARSFHDGFGELAATSRALIEARRGREGIAEKIQLAVLKPLDIETPTLAPLASPGANRQMDLGKGPYPQNPESSAIFRLLVFLRYGITFRELIQQIDIEKNAAAHRRLMAVHRDYWRLLSGHTFKDLKLKFSQIHFDIMTQGIDFGLDNLTPFELSDCLNEICPCGVRHSPQYYKKLRIRLKQACNRLL